MAISRATLGNMRQNLVTVAGLLAGVFSGDIHMAGGMLVHQLSVLIVIANGMRLLRVPKAARGHQSGDAGVLCNGSRCQNVTVVHDEPPLRPPARGWNFR